MGLQQALNDERTSLNKREAKKLLFVGSGDIFLLYDKNKEIWIISGSGSQHFIGSEG